MTLTQLKYIVALDTYRHFVTAAEKCYVTQPALTAQVKRLEEELGIRLFDRSRKPLVPTEVGYLVVEQARFILQEGEKVREIIDEFKEEVKGDLRVGIIPTVGPYLIPLFIDEFAKKYPRIRLIVKETNTSSILQDIKSGLLDVGIISTPIEASSITVIPMFYERFFAYVSKGHPLYRKNTLAIHDLAEYEVWLLKEGSSFRNQVINICKVNTNAFAESTFRYESSSVASLKRIIDSQIGIAIIPELAAFDLPPEKRPMLKRFKDTTPVREISLVVGRSFLKKRFIEKLQDSIINNIPKKMKNPAKGEIIDTNIKSN